MKGQLLAELDWLKCAFRQAWEGSLRPQESNIVQRKEPSGHQVITTRTDHCRGNPAFLSNLRWCIELSCRLRGMDKSVKQPFDPGEYQAMLAAMRASVPGVPREEADNARAA